MMSVLTLVSGKEDRTLRRIRVSEIARNPNQPRKYFDPEAIAQLAESIRQYGVLNPLTVRRAPGGGYELVAGERRLRAARVAGLNDVPCLLIAADNEDSSAIALVENLQRRDLYFFEEAYGFKRLIDQYGLTQEEAARKVGKTQSAVANKLRLLRLPGWVQEIVEEGQLSERHARALLRLEREEDLRRVLDQVRRRNLTVEQTEALVDDCLSAPKEPATRIVLLRDYRLFVNTLNRAVQTMAQAGIRVEQESREEGEYVEYRIRVPKVQAYRQSVPARHAGDPLAAKR